MGKIKGFTIIELMIVIVIVGILAKVAISSYSSYTQKSRRADAVNTLLAISMAEERYRANNSTYGTLAQVWNNVSTSNQGFYTITITNVTATTYTITATGTGTQATDTEGSTACNSMVLTFSNGSVTNTPAACWPT